MCHFLAPLLARFEARYARAARYAEAYRRYCWPVASLDDYRIAPFHLLATEGALHMDKDHLWHMAEVGRLAEPGDRIMVATTHHLADLADPASADVAARWWTDLTAGGGEGMVVKPRDFIAQGRKGWCSGPLSAAGRSICASSMAPSTTPRASGPPAQPRPREEALAGNSRVPPWPGGA